MVRSVDPGRARPHLRRRRQCEDMLRCGVSEARRIIADTPQAGGWSRAGARSDSRFTPVRQKPAWIAAQSRPGLDRAYFVFRRFAAFICQRRIYGVVCHLAIELL